jgi:hypothetical protein
VISVEPEPPERVTATRFLFLTDKANGTVVAISSHETENDMRRRAAPGTPPCDNGTSAGVLPVSRRKLSLEHVHGLVAALVTV